MEVRLHMCTIVRCFCYFRLFVCLLKLRPGARFSKVPVTIRAQKAVFFVCLVFVCLSYNFENDTMISKRSKIEWFESQEPCATS